MLGCVGRGVKASKEKSPPAWLPGVYASPEPNRTGCSDSSAADRRCSICSRAAFRPVPTQARGEGGCSPSPNPALLRQHSYLKFKGCSEQIKGEKKADTICLGEANCKQFCYSTAFYLSIDTDPAAGA